MERTRVLVAMADGFEEIEALATVDILRRAGCEVVMAGVDAVNVTGSNGIRVACDCLIADAGTDFQAMVLPGGSKGSRNLAASWAVTEKMLMIASTGSVIAAICAAPAVVLWPAGVLEGRQAVCYPGMEQQCPGFTFGTQRVCTDGNIITARAAGCTVEFALAIVEALVGTNERDRIARSILHSR
jgi:4-methyl-5(b-hydroxyethyl)-thiazole monophosphate biosynthesis